MISLLIVSFGECSTCVVLPETLYADDMGLQVGLSGLYVDVVPYVVHSVPETAVLTVCTLDASLPQTTRRIFTLVRL